MPHNDARLDLVVLEAEKCRELGLDLWGSVTSSNYTPLHCYAGMGSSAAVLSAVICLCPAALDVVDHVGYTPYTTAVNENSTFDKENVVKALEEAGKDREDFVRKFREAHPQPVFQPVAASET